MKIELNYGQSIVSLPGITAEKLSALSEIQLRVLILICADSALRCEQADAVKELSSRLSVYESEADGAIKSLRESGFLLSSPRARRNPTLTPKKGNETEKKEDKKSETEKKGGAVMPSSYSEYTGEQIASLIEQKPEYKVIIDESQKICGSIFTPTEVSRVIGLADYLGMSLEHILLLFSYCAGKGKNSVAYVTKTAYTLYNQGIDNLAAFEEYVKTAELFDSMTGKVRKIFGMGSRALSAKEKETIAGWCGQEYSEELIKLAYDVAINNNAKVPFSYTAKVLEKWNSAGYRTVADVEAARDRYRQQKMQNTSFDTDEFFEAALKRGNKKLGDKNGEK